MLNKFFLCLSTFVSHLRKSIHSRKKCSKFKTTMAVNKYASTSTFTSIENAKKTVCNTSSIKEIYLRSLRFKINVIYDPSIRP